MLLKDSITSNAIVCFLLWLLLVSLTYGHVSITGCSVAEDSVRTSDLTAPIELSVYCLNGRPGSDTLDPSTTATKMFTLEVTSTITYSSEESAEWNYSDVVSNYSDPYYFFTLLPYSLNITPSNYHTFTYDANVVPDSVPETPCPRDLEGYASVSITVKTWLVYGGVSVVYYGITDSANVSFPLYCESSRRYQISGNMLFDTFLPGTDFETLTLDYPPKPLFCAPIKLFNAYGVCLDSTYTDGDGYYTFPRYYYSIEFNNSNTYYIRVYSILCDPTTHDTISTFIVDESELPDYADVTLQLTAPPALDQIATINVSNRDLIITAVDQTPFNPTARELQILNQILPAYSHAVDHWYIEDDLLEKVSIISLEQHPINGTDMYTGFFRFGGIGNPVMNIVSGDFTNPDVIAHEYGHWIAYKLGVDPTLTGSENHSIRDLFSTGKQTSAFVEGFAYFFACEKKNSEIFESISSGNTGNFSIDLETGEILPLQSGAWQTANSRGPLSEISAACLLWDLVDDDADRQLAPDLPTDEARDFLIGDTEASDTCFSDLTVILRDHEYGTIRDAGKLKKAFFRRFQENHQALAEVVQVYKEHNFVPKVDSKDIHVLSERGSGDRIGTLLSWKPQFVLDSVNVCRVYRRRIAPNPETTPTQIFSSISLQDTSYFDLLTPSSNTSYEYSITYSSDTDTLEVGSSSSIVLSFGGLLNTKFDETKTINYFLEPRTINANETLYVSPYSKLFFADSGKITINNGGVLFFTDHSPTDDWDSLSVVSVDNGYELSNPAIVVNAGGKIQGNYARFSRFPVAIESNGGTIDIDSSNFDYCNSAVRILSSNGVAQFKDCNWDSCQISIFDSLGSIHLSGKNRLSVLHTIQGIVEIDSASQIIFNAVDSKVRLSSNSSCNLRYVSFQGEGTTRLGSVWLDYDSTYCSFSNCTFKNLVNGVDAWGSKVVVDSCLLDSCDNGIVLAYTPSNAVDTIRYNYITNCNKGIYSVGGRAEIRDNHLFYNLTGMKFSNTGSYVNLIENSIEYGYSNYAQDAGVWVGTSGNPNLKCNTIRYNSPSGIRTVVQGYPNLSANTSITGTNLIEGNGSLQIWISLGYPNLRNGCNSILNWSETDTFMYCTAADYTPVTNVNGNYWGETENNSIHNRLIPGSKFVIDSILTNDVSCNQGKREFITSTSRAEYEAGLVAEGSGNLFEAYDHYQNVFMDSTSDAALEALVAGTKCAHRIGSSIWTAHQTMLWSLALQSRSLSRLARQSAINGLMWDNEPRTAIDSCIAVLSEATTLEDSLWAELTIAAASMQLRSEHSNKASLIVDQLPVASRSFLVRNLIEYDNLEARLLTRLTDTVSHPIQTLIVKSFQLHPIYPNPFNSIANIRFDLPEAGQVRISVYDVMGRLVTNLVDGNQGAGYHKVQWNGSNVSSGVYFVTIHTGKFNATRKAVLLK